MPKTKHGIRDGFFLAEFWGENRREPAYNTDSQHDFSAKHATNLGYHWVYRRSGVEFDRLKKSCLDLAYIISRRFSDVKHYFRFFSIFF